MQDQVFPLFCAIQFQSSEEYVFKFLLIMLVVFWSFNSVLLYSPALSVTSTAWNNCTNYFFYYLITPH
jgi:hypothetical protein